MLLSELIAIEFTSALFWLYTFASDVVGYCRWWTGTHVAQLDTTLIARPEAVLGT